MRFRVRLTPKGGRDAIEGWWRDAAGRSALKARVAAPPEDGKANTALISLVAQTLEVRMLGYGRALLAIEIEPGLTRTVQVTLVTQAIALQPVEITGHAAAAS